MLYLGIDQHSKQLTVCMRNEGGKVVLRRQVSTEPARVLSFLDEVQAAARDQGGFAVTLEVCGFNDWLIALLEQYGCRHLVLIHPDKRSKRKTDRRDANSLSESLWLNRERLAAGSRLHGLRQVVLPTPADQEARELTALRQRLAQRRTRTLNQIQGLLRRHNLMWECPTKGFQTRKVETWLREMLSRLRPELTSADRLSLQALMSQWRLWDDQLLVLDGELRERADQNPDVELLRTIPGVSHYSGLTLACRIGSIERFPGPRSLANYFGLTPGCRNSGEMTDRLGSITKDGSRIARFILGQLVLHVLKQDPAMRAWYVAIKHRRGSKIARVAVMRRLTTIIWHMLKHREPYRVGGVKRLSAPAEQPANTAEQAVKSPQPKSESKPESKLKSKPESKPKPLSKQESKLESPKSKSKSASKSQPKSKPDATKPQPSATAFLSGEPVPRGVTNGGSREGLSEKGTRRRGEMRFPRHEQGTNE